MFSYDSPLKYLWEERYEAALLETNDDKLRTRIAAALDSMGRRLIALKPKESEYAKEEYDAIRNARELLRSLGRIS